MYKILKCFPGCILLGPWCQSAEDHSCVNYFLVPNVFFLYFFCLNPFFSVFSLFFFFSFSIFLFYWSWFLIFWSRLSLTDIVDTYLTWLWLMNTLAKLQLIMPLWQSWAMWKYNQRQSFFQCKWQHLVAKIALRVFGQNWRG